MAYLSSASPIYALRQEGRLDEARQKAEAFLLQDNTDNDVWMAYAWTLIDICKRELGNGNQTEARQISDYLSQLHFDTRYNQFARNLVGKIQELRLSMNPFHAKVQEARELSRNGDNDRAWEILSQMATDGNLPIEAHESYGWIIYRYLRDHLSSLGSVQVRTQLRDYLNLRNERPSMLHSMILGFALNYSKQDDNFKLVAFLRLWGPGNLRNEDYEDAPGNNGKSIPSLISRIASAIADYPYEEVCAFVRLLPRKRDAFIEMLKERFFWKLYHSTEKGVSPSAWDLFEQYLTFFPEAKASPAHSKVLNLAERVMKDNESYRFYGFFKRWNPSKLRQEDWEDEKGENGQTYSPLAFKCIKKAKEATEKMTEDQMGDLQWLIDLYETAIEKKPDDDWCLRSKALLHIRAGHSDEARRIYKDLCRRLGDKFYIWQEFAGCCKEPRIKIALLCKALSLEKNEDFLGKIRLELARMLIQEHQYEHALVELNRYKTHFAEKGWKTDSETKLLIGQCGHVTPAQDKNTTLYSHNIPIAEDYAFEDIPFTEAVLVDRWTDNDGQINLRFVNGEQIDFLIKGKRFPALIKSHSGQVWKFRLFKEDTNIRYLPLTATPSDKGDWSILPVLYGYVYYINTEKGVYHIYSSEGTLVHTHYDRQTLGKGDFVRFRQYKRTIGSETKVCICDLRKCKGDEVPELFKTSTAVVENVSDQNQAIYFVLEGNTLSGKLSYDRTELRPSVGDYIKLKYFTHVIEDKKNPGRKKEVIEVIQAETTDDINNNLVKDISGFLELKYKERYGGETSFAFVGNYYVSKSLLKQYSIDEDCHITGKAVATGNGKWRVFKIDTIELEDEDF